jgi:hypothetical protein
MLLRLEGKKKDSQWAVHQNDHTPILYMQRHKIWGWGVRLLPVAWIES